MPGFVLEPVDKKLPKIDLPNVLPYDEGDTFSPLDMGDFTLEPAEVDQQVYDDLRGPTRVGGIEVPGMGPVQDYFNGFNKTVANTLEAIVPKRPEIMNEFLGWMNGKGYVDKPRKPQEMIKEFFDASGLTYDDVPVNQLMEDIGHETFQQSLITAAMLAGAGPMAAIEGPGVMAAIARQIGQFTKANPGATLTSNIGAGAGAQVAGGENGMFPGNPLAEIAGSVLGAGAGATQTAPAIGKLLGGGIGATLGGIGSMLTLGPFGAVPGTGAGGVTGWKWGSHLAEKVLRSGIPLEKAALLGRELPQEATEYARQAVMADRTRIEEDMAMVYRNLAGDTADPQQQAEGLRATVRGAYKTAQARASDLWSRVDMNQKVGVSNARQTAAMMVQNNPRTAPELLPHDILTKIGMLGRPVQTATKTPLPKYGTTSPSKSKTAKAAPVTLKDLRGIQELIGAKLREENLPDSMTRNLTLLNKAIDQDIAMSNPDDKALAVAREYTTWLHDHLSRGPLGKFIGREANAYQLSQSGDLEAALGLIRQSEAGTAIAETAARLNMPELEQQAAQFMKSHLAEEWSRTNSPEQVSKLMAAPGTQRFMQAFPKQAASFNADASLLSASVADAHALENSAFKAYAGTDPQTAIRGLFGGGQKVQKVQEIKAGLMGNADAMRGFKNGTLVEFYNAARGSPRHMADMLAAKDTRGMLAEVLGPEDMTRLERMVRAGEALEKQGKLAGSRTMLGMLSRYIFAGAARNLGAKTIQQTGTAATIGQNLIETMTSVAPARDLFTKAIVDPKWERLLYSRVPATLREMQATQELVKGAIGTLRAAQSGRQENRR